MRPINEPITSHRNIIPGHVIFKHVLERFKSKLITKIHINFRK
jgi:hypothetical protein